MPSFKIPSDASDPAGLIEALKSTILAKDARIERLETENKRLVERNGVLEGASAVVTVLPSSRNVKRNPPRADADETPPAPATNSASVEPLPFLKTSGLRLASKLLGVYPDAWAEPDIRIRLIAEKAFAECLLALWFPPAADTVAAEVSVFLNGKSQYRARVPTAALSEIKFALPVEVGKMFELQIVSDSIIHPPLPDVRKLSYVIHSIDFA